MSHLAKTLLAGFLALGLMVLGSTARAQQEAAALDYWIGVALRPADEALLSHLKLDHGLVVEQIVPHGPADKAGLKRHDLLLKFAGKPARQVDQITRWISASDGGAVEAELLRAGERTTLTITPEPRPAQPTGPLPNESDVDGIRRWVERFQRGDRDALRMLFLRPGVVLPDDLPDWPAFDWLGTRLPPNTSITLRRGDNGPAEVTVRRGEESWTTTSDKLDALPDDMRAAVEQMLGLAPRIDLRESPEWRQRLERMLRERPQLPSTSEMEKKLNQMLEQLNRLRDDVGKLRQQDDESR